MAGAPLSDDQHESVGADESADRRAAGIRSPGCVGEAKSRRSGHDAESQLRLAIRRSQRAPRRLPIADVNRQRPRAGHLRGEGKAALAIDGNTRVDRTGRDANLAVGKRDLLAGGRDSSDATVQRLGERRAKIVFKRADIQRTAVDALSSREVGRDVAGEFCKKRAVAGINERGARERCVGFVKHCERIFHRGDLYNVRARGGVDRGVAAAGHPEAVRHILEDGMQIAAIDVGRGDDRVFVGRAIFEEAVPEFDILAGSLALLVHVCARAHAAAEAHAGVVVRFVHEQAVFETRVHRNSRAGGNVASVETAAAQNAACDIAGRAGETIREHAVFEDGRSRFPVAAGRSERETAHVFVAHVAGGVERAAVAQGEAGNGRSGKGGEAAHGVRAEAVVVGVVGRAGDERDVRAAVGDERDAFRHDAARCRMDAVQRRDKDRAARVRHTAFAVVAGGGMDRVARERDRENRGKRLLRGRRRAAVGVVAAVHGIHVKVAPFKDGRIRAGDGFAVYVAKGVALDVADGEHRRAVGRGVALRRGVCRRPQMQIAFVWINEEFITVVAREPGLV